MSKRQLGIILIVLACGAAVAVIAVDLLQVGNFQGIGPAQRLALLVAAVVLLIGVSLLPLGDRPA